MYDLAQIICTFLFNLFFDLESEGLEKVPSKGPLLLCSNHASNLDPFLVGTVIKDRQLWFMAKSEAYLGSFFFGWVFRRLNMFPVKRQGGDIKAMHKAIEVVRSQRALLLFPEGSRTQDGRLREFKNGIGMIAERSQAPVVPVFIEGSFAALPRGRFWPKLFKIKIHFGDPIAADSIPHVSKKERYRYLTEQIRCRITNLGATT